MHTKAILSVLVIGVSASVAGLGTFAFFTDTANSSSNLFTASTLDLHIGNGESTTATIGNSNFSPGDSVSGSFALVNAGTIENVKVDLDLAFDLVETEYAGDHAAPGNLAQYLKVTALTYGARDLLGGEETCWAGAAVLDGNANGFVDLEDLDAQTCGDLASPGASTTVGVTVVFDTGATNAEQGDSITLTVRALLAQLGATDIAAA